MSRILDWESQKLRDVFIMGIPLNTPLTTRQIKVKLSVVLQEFGELSKIDLLPTKPTYRNMCAIVQFAWHRNAIECIKYLHDKDVSDLFQVTGPVRLNAKPSRKKDGDVIRTHVNPAEKRELLDLLNEKARKHQDSVALVAKAVGKSNEVYDTSDIYAIYDLVKPLTEPDMNSFIQELDQETDSEDEPMIELGDPKELWENMSLEHKKIVQDIFNAASNDAQNTFKKHNTRGPIVEFDETNAFTGGRKKTYRYDDLMKPQGQ